jgi:transposase
LRRAFDAALRRKPRERPSIPLIFDGEAEAKLITLPAPDGRSVCWRRRSWTWGSSCEPDALGNPLKIILTAGQVHDLAGADALLPDMKAAGKVAVIPPKRRRKSLRKFDKALYEARHLTENFFCWVMQFRAIATRYDKTARNFLAAFNLVAVLCWLN